MKHMNTHKTVLALLLVFLVSGVIWASQVVITWSWEPTEEGITAFRYQMDGEADDAWAVVDASVTTFETEPLDDSVAHTLYVQQSFDGELWSESGLMAFDPVVYAATLAPVEEPAPPETEEVALLPPADVAPGDVAPVEAVSTEAPAEEIPAEIPAEEPVVEEVVSAEIPAEEIPAEIPAEEPVVEEIITAEIPAEEIPVAEIPAEEPVVEEIITAEVPAEEIPAEVPAEEVTTVTTTEVAATETVPADVAAIVETPVAEVPSVPEIPAPKEKNLALDLSFGTGASLVTITNYGRMVLPDISFDLAIPSLLSENLGVRIGGGYRKQVSGVTDVHVFDFHALGTFKFNFSPELEAEIAVGPILAFSTSSVVVDPRNYGGTVRAYLRYNLNDSWYISGQAETRYLISPQELTGTVRVGLGVRF